MLFKEGEQKMCLSALKMSERKENHRALLVKWRKSYYILTLSVWCLSRDGRLRFGLQVLIFSVSQHHTDLRRRSRSRKRSGALKGEFCHSAVCAPDVSPHVSSPEGPVPLLLRRPVEGLSLGKQNPPGRLLERRAEPRHYPGSMYRMKLWGAWI